MSNHTKAPWSWQAESKSVAYLVESDDATIIARLSGGDGTNNFSRAAANARRIVACVNACEGIETEELNEYCAVSAKEYQDLEQQRDRLLEALELMVSTQTDGGWTSAALVVAHAAISSVKGGAE